MISLSTYRSKRRIVQVLTTLVIVVLPFLNILRLDIPTLRFYFMSSVLWVDEFYLLFLVLMLLLFVLVFFSMVYGRVWCGWSCPQTSLTEIANWLEETLSLKLKVRRSAGWVSWRRLLAFGLLSAAIGLLSLAIGFNLVAYFVDPYRMLRDLIGGTMGPVTGGFIAGIALTVFADIVFLRETFCTKVCPYGMMQFVITDDRSQIVRYRVGPDEECIECKACVRDCPMDIDIRTSPYQTECIQCGECVDSCDRILCRLDLPSLISFSWGEQEYGSTWWEKIGLVDGKRRIMVGVIAVFFVSLLVMVHMRQPVFLSASGDRSTLYRETEDGRFLNDYSLRISNRSMEGRQFLLNCDGESGQSDSYTVLVGSNPLALKSREVQDLRISILTTGAGLRPGPNRLTLRAVAVDRSEIRAETEIVFFMPEEELVIPSD
jgi:cytochrome c oxidase accessory protein FixG